MVKGRRRRESNMNAMIYIDIFVIGRRFAAVTNL